MSGQDSDTLDEHPQSIADGLARVLDAQVRVIELYRSVLRVNVPRADSLGMQELADEQQFASPDWPNPVQQAHAFAGLVAFAAVDHFDALTTVLGQNEVPFFSCNVTARAALDAAGLALWLAEVVGTERRVKRGVIALAQAGRDLKRAPADLGNARQEGKDIIRTVKEGAAHLGWSTHIPDRGQIEVGGETQPTAKEVIGAAIDSGSDQLPAAPAIWWYLSGFTHPGIHALVQHVMSTAAPLGLDEGVIAVDARQLLAVDAAVGGGVRAALNAYRHLYGAASETPQWDQLQTAWSSAVVEWLKAAG
jgi:hypothetical protein